MGVRPVTVHKYFSQGDFQNTGNTLDVAIEGDGFFLIDYNGQDAYSRAGSFKLNNDGAIVTANGYPLQPQFVVPAETVNVVVTPTGHISALDKNGEELAGTDIQLYTFVNPAGLNAAGRNMYFETQASGAATPGDPGTDNVGTLAQGFLEGSNVELVDEMVSMIVGQRAFEVKPSKAITTSDSMLQTAIQVKR